MKRRMRNIVTGTLLMSVAAIGGCVIAVGNSTKNPPKDRPTAQAQSRVPADAELVAFGRSLRFTAPAEGMVYLVEADSGRLLHATLLQEGDLFRTQGNALRINNDSHTHADWRLPFEDHEVYFRPTDWTAPPPTAHPMTQPTTDQ